MHRRQHLKTLGWATAACLAPKLGLARRQDLLQGKTILLVSGWQYHNIGDMAHTPGPPIRHGHRARRSTQQF